MSKRFGRNQKRRMREDLAAKDALIASQLLDMERMLSNQLMQFRKAEALELIIQGVKEALGKNSVALNPVERMAFNYYIPKIELVERESPRFVSASPVEVAPRELKSITASILRFIVEHDKDLLREHFFVTYQGKDVVGYAIDSREFENKGPGEIRDFIKTHIANVMTEHFAQQLEKRI